MIGAVSTATNQFLAMTQTTASVAYLNCYDVTCFDYDTYNGILWVGNSLGELFGFTLVISGSGERRDQAKGDGEGSFKEDRHINLTNLSSTQNIDIEVIKKLTGLFSGGQESSNFRSLFHYFFQVSSSVFIETGKTMFESKASLVSITQSFKFCTEGGKLSSIKSSSLSNVILAISCQSVVTIWDIFDKCVLIQVHPPHFTQAILLQTVDEKAKLDFRKFLNKDFVSVQPIIYSTFSAQNEDFILLSEDYISLFSLGGVMVASERRSKGKDPFSSVAILEVVPPAYQVYSYL